MRAVDEARALVSQYNRASVDAGNAKAEEWYPAVLEAIRMQAAEGRTTYYVYSDAHTLEAKVWLDALAYKLRREGFATEVTCAQSIVHGSIFALGICWV